MIEFTPPIEKRETEELLEIVAYEKDWNPKAVEIAKEELRNRKINLKEIENAKKAAIEYQQAIDTEKANEGYTFLDLTLNLRYNLFILLFSWELKKDGYIRKAKQQRIFRIVILSLIFIYFIYDMFSK